MSGASARVYRGSVQWHSGVVQGMTVKTQRVTGEDRGFSCGQGFLEQVVYEQQVFFIQDTCPSCVQVHVLQSPPPSNIQVTEDLIN